LYAGEVIEAVRAGAVSSGSPSDPPPDPPPLEQLKIRPATPAIRRISRYDRNDLFLITVSSSRFRTKILFMAAIGYGAPDSSRAATCARLMLRSGSILPGCAARSGSEKTAGPTSRILAVTA